MLNSVFGQKVKDVTMRALAGKQAYKLFDDKLEKHVIDKGMKFIIHFYNEEIYQSLPPPPSGINVNPNSVLLPPYQENFEIEKLENGANHYCIVNKFLVDVGHLIMSSANVNALQTEDLNDEDFYSLEYVLKGLNGNGIGYFNSGTNSGCSQLHKHLQWAPVKSQLIKFLEAKEFLPFKVFDAKINNYSFDEIKYSYIHLMAKMKLSKYIPKDTSYNFIVSNGHAVIVPRKSAFGRDHISVNSLGICGHIFLREGQCESVERGPMCLLEDVCYPNFSE